MAVASPSKAIPLPSSSSDSAKPDADAVSESSSVSGISGTAADFSEQSDSPLLLRRDADSLSAASFKTEEYRQLFHLPPEEVLIRDFNCAFQENILLQGHMYLFVHHICFYSNIFGFETKKTIPFHEVTCVRKAKTAAIFHNAIEIVAGVKKYFFASFLSRDEAYRLIVDGWSQHSTSAKTFLENQEAKPESSGQDVLIFFEKLKNFTRSTNDLDSVDRSKDAEVTEECTRSSNGEIDVAVSTKLSEQQDDREEYVATVSSKVCSTWNPGDEDAPKIPDYYTMVAESEFPIQAEEFYNNFFSDGAVDFVEAFHRKCGDREFRCTPWYEHDQFGHARDLSFQHPIKIYLGAKCGQCQEVQKFRFYKNSHLVVETSQQVNDVPYGDYFRVEGIWDVVQGSETNGCVLRVYANVAFSKKTVFKGKIEQSTMEECREAYAIWISNAHELLKQKQTSATSEGVVESATNTARGNGYHMTSSGKREGLLEELSENRSPVRVLHQPSLSKEKQMNNPVEIGLDAAASCLSLFKELWSSLCLYMKNQNLFSVAVVGIFVLLFLIMQMTIIILLTKEPKIHLILQENFLGGLNSNRAEAVAWLEKRVHHLKEEMLMVEARLEKMRLEYVLLKSYLHGLEQHESKS